MTCSRTARAERSPGQEGKENPREDHEVRGWEGGKWMCSAGRNDKRSVLPSWRVIQGHFFGAFWKKRPWLRDIKICLEGVFKNKVVFGTKAEL